MSNNVDTIFLKIHNETKTKLFHIKTEWHVNFFNLLILEQNSAWSKKVNETQLRNLADQHEIQHDTYYENVKNYICNGNINISIDIVNNQFIVYRSNPTQKLRLKYFFINLDDIDYPEAVELFLEDYHTKYLAALKNLNVLQEQKEEMLKQKILVESQCANFVELKRKSDLKMYSAFALILNEKKRRIHFLSELLEEYTTGRKKKVKVENTTSTVSEFPDGEESGSESNGSEGYNTDNDQKPKINNVESVPSTSKTDLDFLGGDSPPPSLPKRVKVSTSISNAQPIVSFPPCTKDTLIEDNVSKPQYDADTDEDEAIDFNTQDFLDRM